METVARGRSASFSYPYGLKKFGICQECQVTKHKASAMGPLACFHIMLTYYPRTRNGKTDVLSQMFGGPKKKRLKVRMMSNVAPVRWQMRGLEQAFFP